MGRNLFTFITEVFHSCFAHLCRDFGMFCSFSEVSPSSIFTDLPIFLMLLLVVWVIKFYKTRSSTGVRVVVVSLEENISSQGSWFLKTDILITYTIKTAKFS